MLYKLILTIIFLICIFIIYNGIGKVSEKFTNYTPNYVFWTGGYDSTFRVCELLVVHKVPVQPVYLDYNLDSANKTDFWVRKNRRQEYAAMSKVKKLLFERFPHTKNLLYNTIIIKQNTPYQKYDEAFNSLNLWPKKRRIHQYGHLGKVSFLMKTYIDIGVLGLHEKTPFVKFVRKNLEEEEYNNRLNINSQHPLHYLKFPLFDKTKKDLCDISRQHNFDDIIKSSWSCWFPKEGKPCGKCPMCRERFDCN